MSRIATCMGLDPDNKSYLEKRGGSAAEFVNWLIRKYREREGELRKTVGEPPNPSHGKEALVPSSTDGDIDSDTELELKAMSYLADNPQIIYAIKKSGKPPNRAKLCRLKDEMYYSKYEVDVTLPKLRKILRMAVETFNIQEYEDSRGIQQERH